ncbi:MAG: hypothetical protein Q7V17_00465 [Afipia sp.]|nr:hypothetical protein [Afipia sp.]
MDLIFFFFKILWHGPLSGWLVLFVAFIPFFVSLWLRIGFLALLVFALCGAAIAFQVFSGIAFAEPQVWIGAGIIWIFAWGVALAGKFDR